MAAMGEEVLRATSDVIGVSVHDRSTAERLGEVVDVIVHPTEGRLIGFALHTRFSVASFLLCESCEMNDGVLLADGDALHDARAWVALGGVAAARGLCGTSIVTDSGELLGRIEEVCVLLDSKRTRLEVARAGWRRLIFPGFTLAGDAPRAHSTAGRRLIVADADRDASRAERRRVNLLLERYGLALWAAITASLLGAMIWI
jgi:sporulation protein YlmC with PRC-barrel domain